VKQLRQEVEDAAPSDPDKKRIADILEINATLRALTLDARFQEDLSLPRVKVALACWAGRAAECSPEDVEAARYARARRARKRCGSLGVAH
jgi:hypothetical protein